MPLTLEAFQQLDGLFAGDPHSEAARERMQGIEPADLTAWFQVRVANPTAERYLYDLFCQAEDARTYRRFYRELTVRLRPRLRRTVLGWGEISTVVEIRGSPITVWRHPDTGVPMRVVYKKMPPFLDGASAKDFVERYLEYNATLHHELGIAVPSFDARVVERDEQVFIFVIQERVDPASVGHEILRDISPPATERLYTLILREYEKLFRFNQARAIDGYQIGLDGQIPNWAVMGYGGDPDALTGEEALLYLDTNVPMIRIHGQDVVSADMYFQALPGAAKWLIKRLNLDQEVMDRYFDVRTIMLDFLGNLIVRHRADLVPRLIELSNEALAGPFSEGHFVPFTLKEVESYYKSDVATWRLWRSLKLLGALSDGLSEGNWRVLRRMGEFHGIWTQPIF
jgi:hypothetical protein